MLFGKEIYNTKRTKRAFQRMRERETEREREREREREEREGDSISKKNKII